ncbi:S1-C subfamily serine protease [Deinobacterium chartae]|uniref:S1-C subfamily serine protease n=1 Tax=Deinobacterium chartae TaxID=521158 RepID=A0A841HWT3_9DEIO|nr:trypsin-like peptidase domain-containing protein [Deinobacterium chartae]MBB6097323.1 S1-C subfamily serine protease [Deinobacterium chartae]
MKRTVAVVSILLGMVLGATLLRDNVPVGSAQNTLLPVPEESAQTPLNERNARLENERNTIDIVRNYQDGVIFINTATQVRTLDPFGSFFGNSQGEQVQRGQGSGFFINDAGLALTNYHVVEGADEITVKLHRSEREFKARVIGTAPDYDLALIRVENVPKNLYTAMRLGDSSRIEPGQKAVAMGAPFGLDFSVTEGIVSAIERVIGIGVRNVPQKAIQTDAAINPGNSGGPLLNSSGEVIGVNTQILSPSGSITGVGQSAGVGFAIPINVVKNLLPRLERGETVTGPQIGVSLFTYPLSIFSDTARRQYRLPTEGALILEVQPNSPAARAGLRGGSDRIRTQLGTLALGGDVIVAIGGERVQSPADVSRLLFDKQPGSQVRIDIVRNGQRQTVTVTIPR